MRAEGSSELFWRSLRKLPENAGEVALIGEAALHRNRGQRILRFAQFATGCTHPQPLQLIAGCQSLGPAKRSRQMHRMHPRLVRQMHILIMAENSSCIRSFTRPSHRGAVFSPELNRAIAASNSSTSLSSQERVGRLRVEGYMRSPGNSVAPEPKLLAPLVAEFDGKKRCS